MTTEEELMYLVAGVRFCPLGCGWQTTRRIKSSHLQSPLGKLPAFIERCRLDIAVHLIEHHDATREYETVEVQTA